MKGLRMFVRMLVSFLVFFSSFMYLASPTFADLFALGMQWVNYFFAGLLVFLLWAVFGGLLSLLMAAAFTKKINVLKLAVALTFALAITYMANFYVAWLLVRPRAAVLGWPREVVMREVSTLMSRMATSISTVCTTIIFTGLFYLPLAYEKSEEKDLS